MLSPPFCVFGGGGSYVGFFFSDVVLGWCTFKFRHRLAGDSLPCAFFRGGTIEIPLS